MAVVLRGDAGSLLHRPDLLQPVLIAEAVVGCPFLHQLEGVVLEHPHPLALDIRTHRPPHVGALVPQKTGLPEGIIDDVHRSLHVPLLVGVLDAQDEDTILGFGGEVGIQGGAQVPNVHIAGGTGGKTGADFIKAHCD